MKRFAFLLGSATLIGCASSGEDPSGVGGAGGAVDTVVTSSTSSTTVSSTASTVVASSSASGGCSQDCSMVPVPLCFESVCNTITHSCEIKPAADDSPCEDGLFCTDHDTCQSGVCKAGDPLVCPDSGDDPCLTVTCDEDTDSCESAPAANGTPCVGTDLCTDNAICQNGNCLGAPKDCSSTPLPDDCHVASCDSTTGDCIAIVGTDGLPCIGGDACESNKTCTAGVCSGTPIVGCNICSEAEVNNDIATANDDATCTSWGGSIGVVGDKDFYQVDVTVAGSRVQAEVNDTTPGSCPVGFDSVIHLLDATGVSIATDDDNGVNACSLMSATTTGSTNLAVGTYYLSVEEFGNNATSPPYVLNLAVLPPGCGNAVVEGTEQCDGSNLSGQSCQTQGFGTGTLGCDASCNFDTSACNPPACGDGIIQGTEDCDGAALGGATCPSLGFSTGTLSCDAACNYDTSACNPAGCGDGILQPGEECDDANLVNGDACDSTCHFPACTGTATKVTVSGTGLPLAIPDNTPAGITNTVNVAQAGVIQSVWVNLNITHTYENDLAITLTPPAAGAVTLIDNIGFFGSDNFTNTTLASLATNAITAGMPPFTGIFAAMGTFTPAIGTTANGTWALNVADQVGADIGTLDSWTLTVCVQ